MQNQMKDIMQRLSKLEDDNYTKTLQIENRSQQIQTQASWRVNFGVDNEIMRILANEARAIRMRFLDVYQRYTLSLTFASSRMERNVPGIRRMKHLLTS